MVVVGVVAYAISPTSLPTAPEYLWYSAGGVCRLHGKVCRFTALAFSRCFEKIAWGAKP